MPGFHAVQKELDPIFMWSLPHIHYSLDLLGHNLRGRELHLLHKPNCVQLSYVLGWHRPGSCTVNYTNYYYCAISSNGLCKLLRLRRTYIVMPACTALIGKITQISSISSICTLSSKINFTTRYNSKTDCCYTQI